MWNAKVQYCIDSLAVEPYSELPESIQTLIYCLFKIYLNTVFLSLPRSCTGCIPFLTLSSCALSLLSSHPLILSPPLHCCFGCTIVVWTKWQTVHCFAIVLQLQLLYCVISEYLKCVYWEFKLLYSSVQSLHVLTFILLMWRIWWAPNNASKWQVGFNLTFKGLMKKSPALAYSVCAWVLCVITNSSYFIKQHWLIGLYNRGVVCFCEVWTNF